MLRPSVTAWSPLSLTGRNIQVAHNAVAIIFTRRLIFLPLLSSQLASEPQRLFPFKDQLPHAGSDMLP